jgi:DNA-binding response OmpR family regulator
MAKLLMLTNSRNSSAEVLPSLSLLQHQVKILPAEVSVLLDAPSIDLLIVDGRRELSAVKNLIRLLNTTGVGAPIILVTTEGGLTAIAADWAIDDVILDTAGPAEVDARIRLTITRYLERQREINPATIEIRGGEIAIDEHSYTAKIKGRSLDLTYKEFELLKYLVQHPGRVFTRSQLLQEVWGYDYFGGTRTVDVHIRRLRAKLGPEHEALIGTVRHVGYRFNTSNSQNQGSVALSEH